MIEYRNATLADFTQVLDWAALEGWNPGHDDAEAFYFTEPEGFFVAADPGGALVAAISVVNHTPDFAFLGLYIVRPDCRGKGIGLGLWEHAIKHAGHRTIGLDGVEAQQENYCASGFVHAGSTTRFTGRIDGRTTPQVRHMRQEDTPTLIHMEAEASAVAKPIYLRSWISGAASRTTIVYEDREEVRGFCTVRACRSGAKVGPLIAADPHVARALIVHAASVFHDRLTLDVPETSIELIELCEELGLEAGFRTARMYRGKMVATNHPNYAVASLELG